MIDIDQALIQEFIDGNFGLPVAHENIDYSPGAAAYAEIIVLQNDVTPLNLAHSDESDGVFRVILRYPINTGAVAAKEMADTIVGVFKIGKRLSWGTAEVVINGYQREPGAPEDGWYKIVLTVRYRAFLTR